MMDINRENILEYAGRHDDRYRKQDKLVEKEMKELLSTQRCLTREDLIKIGRWKSRRPSRHYESQQNDDLTVSDVTKFCFNTKSERAKIDCLMVLKGVSWPVASTILHFAFPNKYPILDFRIIWSLGWQMPSRYDFDFWQRYTTKMSGISKTYDLPLRTVDKALWQYSKENQRR